MRIARISIYSRVNLYKFHATQNFSQVIIFFFSKFTELIYIYIRLERARLHVTWGAGGLSGVEIEVGKGYTPVSQ